MIVSLDMFNRRMGDIECIYVLDFFKQLWSIGIRTKSLHSVDGCVAIFILYNVSG